MEIYVNDVEMTAAGAGLGMDPFDLVVPMNRLVASTVGTTVPVARCGCGVYGCGSTDVEITREGDVVHWDWRIEVPVNRRMTFAADQYDREVDRVGTDLRWETPERRAGRLVLVGLDRTKLAESGLAVSWAASRWNDHSLFEVAFMYRDTHQVFVAFPWSGRDADELAAAVTDHLTHTAPSEWEATWSAVRRDAGVPELAGPRWVRTQH